MIRFPLHSQNKNKNHSLVLKYMNLNLVVMQQLKQLCLY